MSQYQNLKLKIINEFEMRNHGYVIDQDDYDKVFLVSNDLSLLGFNSKITELNRPIIKIKNEKKVIYRKFKQGKNFKLNSNEIGILSRDKNYLDINDEIVEIEIKIASWWENILFYNNNPKTDIRISFRFFIYSIIIGLLSGIISGFIVNYLSK
ncbi:MAG: hypothetical protein NT104_04730 [Bacteroidetes bacterium]|nr:hypothetical protein [Bacteroidota bacterium]